MGEQPKLRRHGERTSLRVVGFTFERDLPDHPDGPAILMVIEATAPEPT